MNDITLLDLSIPDCHFWHDDYAYGLYQKRWVATGDAAELHAMLAAIWFGPYEPSHLPGSWEHADSWNDAVLPGRTAARHAQDNALETARARKAEGRADLGFCEALWVIGPLLGFFSEDVWLRRRYYRYYRNACRALKGTPVINVKEIRHL